MTPCDCHEPTHTPRKIVLTGGPGAGKTAILELVRRSLCHHVEIIPEAASLLFSGGFRRANTPSGHRVVQEAIFHVQRASEALMAAELSPALILCDRGTIDGAAYWPGPDGFYEALGTTREKEFARYDAVIHLRTPGAHGGYDHSNPNRIESAREAHALDNRILHCWEGHPRRYQIKSTPNFMDKAHEAISIIRAELPACCRDLVLPVDDPHSA